MGATYTRQSSSAIVDGGIIEAADINAEFNQILAAFAETSGHTHDGTAAEGGPITKLLGTAITIGDATAGTDIAVTFDGETADGVLTWMEDEDYFQFSDDLLLTTTEKLQFRDTAIYINSSADGQLDLVADTEIQIAATTIDINGAVDISGALTLAGTTLAETISDTVGAMVSSNTETGITVTYEDGDNTLDFVIGTLNQDTTGTAAIATAITVTANNSTDETVYPVFVDGATGTQGAETDSGLSYNPSSGNFTIGGALTAASLDISGDVDVDGTLEADAITVNGTTLAETIADTVGAMVSSNTESGITVAYQDADNTLDFTVGTLNQDTTGTAAIATSITVTANNSTDETVYPIFVDGATGTQGAETDTGLSYNPSTGLLTTAGVTASGTVTYGSLSDGAITVTAFVDEDNMSSDSATLIPTQQSVKAYVDSSMTSAVTASSTTTLTNKTLTAPKFADAGFIADANGNEQVVFQTTSSAVNALEVTNSATGNAIVVGAFGSDSNVDIDITPKGTGEVNIAAGNLNYAGTAITTTGAEINLIDGDTSRGTTAVASGDGILINDAGTMRMTNVDTVSTYFAGHSVGGTNIVTTGALNAGSITSGFGNIDTGSSTITTTGLISGGSLDIDNVLINGTTIGHTDDTDLMTLADGVLTVAGEVSMTTLDIGGTNVSATAAELNYVSGVTSAIQTQLNATVSTGKSIAMALVFG